MDECIKREEAINEFVIRSSFYDAEWGNKRFTLDDVKEILQSITAADVRFVTLCRECEHRFNYPVCIHHSDDWFCGYGKKKEKN